MGKTFNINGSLTANDLNLKGNLTVNGVTNTVNQETLTIKDNLIAVNGNGTILDTVGVAGIVAVTGEENLVLKDGKYRINTQAFYEFLGDSIEIEPNYWSDYVEYWFKITPALQEKFNRFNSLGLCDPDDINNGRKITCECVSDYMILIYSAQFKYSEHLICSVLPPTGEFEINSKNSEPFSLKNQIIKNNEDWELIKTLLLNENEEQLDDTYMGFGAQAYAAPIYDKTDDTLKIGLGSYLKDENGNIKSFTFGAGQGQSIATRNGNIQDEHIVSWSETENKLIDSGWKVDSQNLLRETTLGIGALNLGKDGFLLVPDAEGVLCSQYSYDKISIGNYSGEPYNLILPKENGTLATREWINQNINGGSAQLYKHVFTIQHISSADVFLTLALINQNSENMLTSDDDVANFSDLTTYFYQKYAGTPIDGVIGYVNSHDADENNLVSTYTCPIVQVYADAGMFHIQYAKSNVPDIDTIPIAIKNYEYTRIKVSEKTFAL